MFGKKQNNIRKTTTTAFHRRALVNNWSELNQNMVLRVKNQSCSCKQRDIPLWTALIGKSVTAQTNENIDITFALSQKYHVTVFGRKTKVSCN